MKDCLVTYLRLRHHGSLTITEGREVKALLLLLVPLLEELLHAPKQLGQETLCMEGSTWRSIGSVGPTSWLGVRCHRSEGEDIKHVSCRSWVIWN